MVRSAKPLLLILLPSSIVSIGLATLYFVIFPLFPWLHHYYFPQQTATYATYHVALYTHIAFGSVALLLGSINLFNALRGKHFTIHRYLGSVYVVAVSIASVCASIMAFHAYAGTLRYGRYVVTSGFLTLAILWFMTLYVALYQIAVKHNARRHMFFMLLNFSLTFAAVTLRVEIIPLSLFGTRSASFETLYPVLGWACWLPNIVVASVLAKRIYGTQSIPEQYEQYTK